MGSQQSAFLSETEKKDEAQYFCFPYCYDFVDICLSMPLNHSRKKRQLGGTGISFGTALKTNSGISGSSNFNTGNSIVATASASSNKPECRWKTNRRGVRTGQRCHSFCRCTSRG